MNAVGRRRWRGGVVAWSVVWCLWVGVCGARGGEAASVLTLAQVMGSVTNQYPPYLAALIERDIAAGRLRSARGAFDFTAFAKVFGTPAGYYERGTLDTGFEQFTGIWGSTVFGGYRLTRGDLLPDYDGSRTQGDGEVRAGVRIPLLRDGSIDRRRAALMKASLDQKLADPLIARQRLDFVRAATVAYYGWLGAGRRLELAEELLKLAKDRNGLLGEQAQAGLTPPIVLTDNQRLVVAREIGLVQARRRFEGASLALSLFYRGEDDQPIVAGRERAPGIFPTVERVEVSRVSEEWTRAWKRRPELARLRLGMEKLEVDLRLARNQMRPNLDAGASVSQDFGGKTYKDKSELEVQTGIELRMPLQRREAKGRLAEVEGQIQQLKNDQRMAEDRIRMEVQDSLSALRAAYEQVESALLNVKLAEELRSAEAVRFLKGATDLLALQIREQAAFEAGVLAVEAQTEYFRAEADYRAATAADLP